MKKLVLSIMTMAMIVAFVSCEKENLGVFNPKMKIYKVYNETDGHYLQEKWLWNDKQLHKVEYYKKNGDLDQTYLYQYENGLLSSIKTDNQHTDFEYDGKTLTTIKTYYGDQLVETYSLSFQKQKLSHISIQKSAKSAAGTIPDILHLFSPELVTYLSKSDAKSERYDYSSAEIDFTWEKNNVKYMKMKIDRPDSVQNLTFTYVYDENINPKKNYFSLLLDHVLLNDEPQTFFCSANNAIGVYVTDSYDIFSESDSFTYAYDYYKKYPTKVYSTWFDDETLTEKKDLLYSYEYLN
ncbi:MAG: hypothetical protein IKZ54_02180 [Bacteroidales bacterium]|nr:hypothetical protein [Bacteroidales bacterium]